MVKIIIIEMAYWANWGETIPFFYRSFLFFLNEVDKDVGQWTKYASQQSEFYTWLWRWPVCCRSSHLTSVSLSFFFCKIKRKGWFTLVAFQCWGRTSPVTWEWLPGKEKSARVRAERVPSKSNPSYFFVDQKDFYANSISDEFKTAEMNLKCLTYAFSALSSNYDNLGGYVNYTILVKWHNYEMLGQKQKRITLL